MKTKKVLAAALLLASALLPLARAAESHLRLPERTAQPQAPSLAELRKRAEAGDAEAQYSLFLQYQEGKCSVEDRAEAVGWLRKAAEAGHATAQVTLGLIYKRAYGESQGIRKRPFSGSTNRLSRRTPQGKANSVSCMKPEMESRKTKPKQSAGTVVPRTTDSQLPSLTSRSCMSRAAASRSTSTRPSRFMKNRPSVFPRLAEICHPLPQWQTPAEGLGRGLQMGAS